MLWEGNKVWGAVSFLLVVFTAFGLPWAKSLPVWASRLPAPGLVLVILIASYRMWISHTRLVVEPEEVKFCSFDWSSQQMPGRPGITLFLAIRNAGREKVKLTSLRVGRCDLGTDMFELGVAAFSDASAGQKEQPMRLPYDIPGRDYRRVKCRLPTPLATRDAKQFAGQINQLKGFSLELEYVYEDMDGREERPDPRRIQGKFDAFKQACLSRWGDSTRQDLLEMAKAGIEDGPS